MSRTRVHNLFVSSDGFATGDHVTLEHPIGGAEALFSRSDGREDGWPGWWGDESPLLAPVVIPTA